VIFADWIYLIIAAGKCIVSRSIRPQWGALDWVCAIAFTVGVAEVAPMWFFIGDNGTPGAGDNLISSVMGVVLSKYYHSREKLKNTRLVFLSYDAEEILLRGSRAFFKRHRKEYNDTKAWNFNIDCPYCVHDLKFLTTDVNGFVKLSSRMANRLAEIARELGYDRAKAVNIMFLAGATDAAEAAVAGIEATTLIGMAFSSKDLHGNPMVYHTPNDTIDSIEPEIVQATLRVFMKFVDEVDNGEFP
jgi:Zn-dependent M28 family amino/carboxypeptidase